MWVPQLPERLWWDHNAYYHRWLRKQLPARSSRILDVGCGAGRLACALSARADHVDALDRESVMVERARQRCTEPNVNFIQGDLLDPSVALSAEGYDAITAVSSVHHMSLRPALARLTALLRPGGVLVLVGHYRPDTATDRALELISLPANAVVGAALAVLGRAGKPDDDGMPVLPPADTLTQIRRVVKVQLPGATLRRGLFWRYLLSWQRQ